jgi:hypothetical protein
MIIVNDNAKVAGAAREISSHKIQGGNPKMVFSAP